MIKNGFFIFLLVLISQFFGILYAGPMHAHDKNEQRCVKVAIVHSAEFYAKELGWRPIDVLSSYYIRLWEKPTNAGKGKQVGKMRVGSHARIISEITDDYLVESPLDHSIGYVNKMHFSGTTYQDKYTYKPCTP